MSSTHSKAIDEGSKQDMPARLEGAIEDITLALLTLTLPMFTLTGVFLGLVYTNKVDNPPGDSSAYYIDYSATRLATVSSWTSTATSLIFPFSATLLAYPIARSFYQRSSAPDPHQLPTPYQLSIMIGLLGGGLGAMWTHMRYFFWKGRPRIPPVVSLAAVGVILFFVVGLGILAADTWLHVTTTTVPYGIVTPREPPQTQFGRGLSSRCFDPDASSRPDPCVNSGSLTGQSSRALINAGEAYSTLANLSADNLLTTSTIEGQRLAHFVDPKIGFDLDYKANTLAVQTQCRPMSQQCELTQGQFCPRDTCIDINSWTQTLRYSCPGNLTGDLANNTGTAFDLDVGGSSSSLETLTGFFLQTYNDTDFREISSIKGSGGANGELSNPLHFIVGALVPPSEAVSTDPEAVEFSASDNAGVILGCHLTVLELDYDFVNGSVADGTTQQSNNTLATNIGWAMSEYRARVGFQSYIDSAITGAAIAGDSVQDMADRFASSFSEISLGITAGIMTPRASVTEELRQNVLVARLPYAPFFTLLVLNLVYAALGIVLGVWALSTRPRATRDIQARLSIDGLVASLLEPEGIPRRGEGVEGLFTDKVVAQGRSPVAASEKRVAISRVDQRRWAFEVVQPPPILSHQAEQQRLDVALHQRSSQDAESEELSTTPVPVLRRDTLVDTESEEAASRPPPKLCSDVTRTAIIEEATSRARPQVQVDTALPQYQTFREPSVSPISRPLSPVS